MNQVLLVAIVGVASAFVGGGVWSFASTWLSHIFHRGEKEIDRLREDLADVRREHGSCEERVEALERRLEIVENRHASLVPRWIRSAQKRILWVNGAAMLTIFGALGRVRDQVEGLLLADLVDVEAAREMDRLDRAALSYPGRAVSTFMPLHAQLPPMHIVTVAGIGRDGELIYETYAYCANSPTDEAHRGGERKDEQLGLSLLRLTGPEAAAGGSDKPPA